MLAIHLDKNHQYQVVAAWASAQKKDKMLIKPSEFGVISQASEFWTDNKELAESYKKAGKAEVDAAAVDAWHKKAVADAEKAETTTEDNPAPAE